MNFYTCNRFSGNYPVGSAAVVRANSRVEAAELLNAELRDIGLDGDAAPEDMKPWTKEESVRILVDGNY